MNKRLTKQLSFGIPEDSSSDEQDDIMSMEEEIEHLNRFKRSQSIHGARRESLEGLPGGPWSRRASLVGDKFLSKDDEVKNRTLKVAF